MGREFTVHSTDALPSPGGLFPLEEELRTMCSSSLGSVALFLIVVLFLVQRSHFLLL